MEEKRFRYRWRYCRYLLILIFLIDIFGGHTKLSAQDNPAVIIDNIDQISTLLELEQGSTHTVQCSFVLDTEAFRAIKVVFSQIKAFIHLDLSACSLAKGTVSLAGTFKDCICLLSVSIPEGILYSGDEVFMGCKNLITINLPESLQIIFSSSFSGCSSLTSIHIPSDVTTIGKNAFQDCSKLTEIILPAKVSGIGTGAFGGCSSLKNIVITSKSRKYTFVSGILFEKISGGKAIHSYVITGNVPLIPPDVNSIFERAFYKNESMYSIIIPENIITIGDEAFAGCRNMVSIELPGSLSFVGRDALKGCISMQEIVIRKTRKIPAVWDKNWIGDLLYGIIQFKQ